ncbi:glycoside hydrolase family 3 protein [Botrytis cinerea T4]|uniref:beta-glucosidase n=1 Tax=Botryotinia fuckeliana (strain T4) TaxID=999810 RepID=G2XP33_BOTF4|nr:glycoside hydrolase family 3 protein [Botrytis cinerea T4]
MSTRRVFSLASFASGSLVGRCIVYNIMKKSCFDDNSPPYISKPYIRMDTNASLLLKISNRELIYFTTIGAGTPLWRDSHVKAMSMIDHMTTEEKSKLTTSVINKDNGCSGITPAIPRVGLPGVYFQDSGNCVRVAEFSSSFPSGIHIGAR